MEIIAIRTRYGKNGYLCWQETFWLAFQRENNVVVKLGVARLVADFGTRAVIR